MPTDGPLADREVSPQVPMSQYLSADDQNWADVNETRGRSLAATVLGQRIVTAKGAFHRARWNLPTDWPRAL